MNFTAHRMNTGLSDIFNEISVGKLQKNDSSPQIANLARINTGIAEMLFGRTETPKGIGTGDTFAIKNGSLFGRTETPKGIGTIIFRAIIITYAVWKNRNPKGDWNLARLEN